MDDKETWKNKMTKNTACKLNSNPIVTKHTTVILPSDKISRKYLKDKIEARIESLKINREYNYTRAGVVLGLKYVLSLLNEIR